MVRAKFQVTKVAQSCYGPNLNVGTEITLTPQYDTSVEEDRRFSKYTPSGTILLYVDNPPAAEQLALGKYFYVDFTEVIPEAK
jgi:hypothetical protein